MTKEIYYATSNAGKFEEVKIFFNQYAPAITVKQFVEEIEEIQSLDQQKIAIDKVKKAWDVLKKPVLIDDGGLFFEAYHNFPGTLSKYVFEGIGFKGIFKLVEDNNRAAFILQLAYTDGQIIKTFEGRCEGEIIQPKDFSSHPQLPFTAIFKPHGTEKTYAELRHSPEFTKFAFRHKALMKFMEWYQQKM